MANKVLTPLLGANLDGKDVSAQHQLGTTVLINGSSDGVHSRMVAVYVEARDIISASAAVAIDASAGASASAGGYVALASANSGEFIWVRSSAVVA